MCPVDTPGASLARHMALFAFPEHAMCARPLALQRSIQATYMNVLTRYDYMRTSAQTATLDPTQRP